MGPQSQAFDYAAVAAHAKEVLEEAFAGAAVQTEEGFRGRVHVKIVSTALNGRSEREKQEMVWSVLREHLGTEAQAVSLVLPYGLDELP